MATEVSTAMNLNLNLMNVICVHSQSSRKYESQVVLWLGLCLHHIEIDMGKRVITLCDCCYVTHSSCDSESLTIIKQITVILNVFVEVSGGCLKVMFGREDPG